MNLEHCLDYIGTYLDDRTTLVDGDPDGLWSDLTLTHFLNHAQRILCRRAWPIIDEGNPTAGIVVLQNGVAVYPLHKSVLRVYLATPIDQETPLGRFDDMALRNPIPYLSTSFFDLVVNPTFAAPGRPIGFATDASTRMLRVYRTPSATEDGLVLNLKVARLPIKWLSLDDPDDEPEVPEDWHTSLCHYAVGRALIMPNVDAQMRTEGRQMLKDFDEVVKEARRDRQRAEMSPASWSFDTTTSLLNTRVR